MVHILVPRLDPLLVLNLPDSDEVVYTYFFTP
jgi:hypothetical protein